MSFTNNLPARKIESFTLFIENFSQLATFKHDNFCINNHFVVYLGVHPKTVVYSTFEYLSVSVENYNPSRTFEIQYSVSILNIKREKMFTKDYSASLNDIVRFHYGCFIPRYVILNQQKGYLYHGLLTLLFEIEVITKENKTTDSSRISFHNDLNCLSEEFGSLLIDDKFTDFTLMVGKDGKELNVHKNILAARSPVFAAMFEHDCEEKRQNMLTITDMGEDVCEEMLRFVYSGKVQSMEKYAMELLEAADKYQMDSLKSLCEHYLSSNLTIETAANVLILSDIHRANGLKSKCIHYITDNANQVKDTEGWIVLNANAKLLGQLFLYSTSQK